MAFPRLMTSPERRRARLLGVAAAVLLVEVVWVCAELVLGLRLQAPAGTGYPEPVDIGPLNVAVASVRFSTLGWAVLAGLERLTSHAHRIWLVGALAGLVASLAMPLSGSGVSPTDRALLVLKHVAVAAILIPVLYRTSPRQLPHPPQRPARVARGEPV